MRIPASLPLTSFTLRSINFDEVKMCELIVKRFDNLFRTLREEIGGGRVPAIHSNKQLRTLIQTKCI